jgi:predicted phosphodiesterase
MLGDFEPIVVDLPHGDAKIYPVFDLHVGSQQFNEKRWKAFKDKLKGEKNSYIIVGGDLMDNGLKNSVTNVYEQTMRPSEQKKYVAEELSDIRDKILCGVSGNHENRSVKESDDSPVYDIFCKLDIENKYRDNAAVLIIRTGNTNMRIARLSSKVRPSYTMLVTHGAGGGMYIGSGANRLERFGAIIDGLDIIVTGHTHKPMTFPVSKLCIDSQNKKVTQKQFTCVVASSWLDYGGYPVRKMLPPTAQIEQEIILSGHGKQVRVLS